MMVAFAPSPTEMTLRTVTKRGSAPARTKTMSSGFRARALGDAHDGAVGHERGVERDDAHRLVAGAREPGRRPTLRALRQARRRAACTSSPRRLRASEARRGSAPLTNTMRYASTAPAARAPRSSSAIVTWLLVIDRRGQRLLQLRAQIGVFPFLDAPVRQAERGESADRLAARPRSRDRPAACRQRPRTLR